MSLLIDGYNLLNVVGIVGRGIGPGGLERARLALLNFLAESLDPKEISKTIVVFDSREAPWGLPRTVLHRGLSVQYASKYPDADCLIEELIEKESAPRRLTVVSSDHRLQCAAKRRRARAVDSDVWYAEALSQSARATRAFPGKYSGTAAGPAFAGRCGILARTVRRQGEVGGVDKGGGEGGTQKAEGGSQKVMGEKQWWVGAKA